MLTLLYMEAVILAAGLSTRMGCNKLLLPFGKSTVLGTVIAKAEPFADRIIVVTGHDRELVESSIKCDKVLFVFNPNYKDGQKTSLLKGIVETSDDFFVLPGDIPAINSEDISKTIEISNGALAARCFYSNIPGHPVVFKKENREKILSYPGPIRNYLEDIGCLKHLGSIGSVFDADTSIRYEALSSGDLDPSLL